MLHLLKDLVMGSRAQVRSRAIGKSCNLFVLVYMPSLLLVFLCCISSSPPILSSTVSRHFRPAISHKFPIHASKTFVRRAERHTSTANKCNFMKQVQTHMSFLQHTSIISLAFIYKFHKPLRHRVSILGSHIPPSTIHPQSLHSSTPPPTVT
jgi:hypothetical protein